MKHYFDFESFYNSIYGFLSPLFLEDRYIHVITQIIKSDEKNRPYGSYILPKDIIEDDKFQLIASFLESFKIYLDDDIYKEFSIHRIFNNFGLISLQDYPFLPTSLREYVEQGKSNSELYSKFESQNVPLKKYILGENLLIKKLIGSNDTTNYFFLPIPIISIGNLVGIAYLIYDGEKLNGNLKLFDIYHTLVLSITREYENVLLRSKANLYGQIPENPINYYKDIFIELGIINSPASENVKPKIITNQFLLELGYDDYYRRFAKVLTKEIDELMIAGRARIKNAITSIIVDSFAHNVGAHSLVALKWWFEKRSKVLYRPSNQRNNTSRLLDPTVRKLPEIKADSGQNKFHSFIEGSSLSKIDKSEMSILDITRFMSKDIKDELLKFYSSDGKEVGQLPVPIDYSIYTYFEFLRNKSAFWSGVTRDTVFVGRIKTWIDILKEFLNNTLFLGTITHSEGVNRINFHIEVLDEKNKVIEGGEFAKVNLDVIAKDSQKNPVSLSPDEKSYSDYAFLREGKKFVEILDTLNKLDPVFLPNGIIGQHALYTIFENTLRNIKHYKKQQEDIKKTGVNFFISIQETTLYDPSSSSKDKKRKKLYKVGTWLHHSQSLIFGKDDYLENQEERESKQIEAVIDRHTTQLKRRIINDYGVPRLGGSSQDKVCAAMLMNNTFFSIDEKDSISAKKHYYPYVLPASEPYVQIEDRGEGYQSKDFFLHEIYNSKISSAVESEKESVYSTELKEYLKNKKKSGSGVVKKFFHIWKGESVAIVSKNYNPSQDNLTRYKIVAIKSLIEKERTSLYQDFRNQGILRLIPANEELSDFHDDQEKYDYAITSWLKDWLNLKNEKVGVRLMKPAHRSFVEIGVAYLQNIGGKTILKYLNKKELERSVKSSNSDLSIEEIKAFHPLMLSHGLEASRSNQSQTCRIRSHCSFMSFIYNGYSFDSQDYTRTNIALAKFNNLEKVAKLTETLLTKITIFDNRLYERLPIKSDSESFSKVFKRQLNLQVFPEDPEIFFNNRISFLKETHFFIVHLSFLELINRETTGKTLDEGDASQFFKREIDDFYNDSIDSEGLPDNFIFVVTSGRGRGDWFKAVEHSQITFRPIESILNAVEDGLSLRDDFQVKYNLCNVLFGS